MYLGIDIGSTTSKVAIINEKKEIIAKVVVNLGTGTSGPKKAVDAALLEAGLAYDDIKYSVATGYGRMNYSDANKQITEISCHAKGCVHLLPQTRTIIDIGGQDAKVILLSEEGRIENFAMNDKCAAGTGRFLEVMARILDCSVDKLADLAKLATEELPISSTCTVFAESEVISQLSSGAKIENVAKGAHRSIAKRVVGLARRIGIKPTVSMTGGVALNHDVVSALELEIDDKIVIPENPQLVGAIGAALYAYEMNKN